MIRRILPALLVTIAVLATACSSSGNKSSQGSTQPTTVTTAPDLQAGWDKAATSTIRNLAIKLQRALPGQCGDPGLLPRDLYVHAMTALKLDTPLAVVDCSAYGGSIEFSVLPTPDARAAWVQRRAEVLCAKAEKAKLRLPGIHWVEKDAWAVQTDNENAARRVAGALGGTFRVTPCRPGEQVDWEAGAESTVARLGAQLAKDATIKCADLQLLDRTEYLARREYANRLPAAYAECASPGGGWIRIAAFSPTSVARDPFTTDEAKLLCGPGSGVQAVRGDGWAVIASDVKVAARAAVQTGGKLDPPAC